jgi:acyl dehydratase
MIRSRFTWMRRRASGRCSYEATSMRPLASKPEWGLVLGTTTAVNQRRELVFFFENSVFLPRRSSLSTG